MYMILIDLEAERFSTAEISEFMNKHGFMCVQRGLYSGSGLINAVSCVIVIQQLFKEFSINSRHVKSLKMFRVDEISDLVPAINLL